jgi:hypothetical protein
MKPFEYDGMSAWEYDTLVTALNAWRLAQKVHPRSQTKQATPFILTEDAGPQFVDDPSIPEFG